MAIDRQTHAILRIRYVGDSIPASFQIRFDSTVDYDYVQLGGHRYWLPAKAVVRTTHDGREDRNEAVFSSYRKFEAQSGVSFGDPRSNP